LLAKQAAEVDVLSGGRLRLVIAAGWNDVEFEALGVSFADRGKIMVEQVEVMRALWTNDVVDYDGKFHTVTKAGINPLPVQRPIPLWFGGQSPVVLKRTGRMADGWFPYYSTFDPVKLTEDLAVIHQAARDAGRDPSDIGIEGAIYFYDDRFPMSDTAQMPPTTLDECVEYAKWWKDFGASRYWVTAPWANLGPEETGVRVPGKKWSGVELRLNALREFKEAVGTDF
jgi:probable F420-dependent oxidoreductase